MAEKYELLSLKLEGAELEQAKAFAQQQRVASFNQYQEAAAQAEEWAGEPIDPDNVAQQAEHRQFHAARLQQLDNVKRRFLFWDERVKAYGKEKGKDVKAEPKP